ncbi:MAG: CPBP family intramembrane metalloprotease [Candidatus Heimdallarchaeota archaeon]|nr:CPBP family intramembrane metalloprotease [Candidatus Heimdallarchaeota archaeon]
MEYIMNKQALTFIASLFLFSWILWIPSVLEYFGILPLGEAGQPIFMITLVIGAFGPLFAAYYALRSEGKSFKEHVKTFFSLKGITWPWVIFVVLIPLLINALAILIGMLLQLEIPESRLPSIWVYFPYMIFTMFLGGGQEELGWRWYLQQKLSTDYRMEITNVIIGIVWAVWHLPLWFMLYDEHNITPFFAFMLMTISISFVYYFIIDKTGNGLLTMIFHGAANSANATFYVQYLDNPSSNQPLYWIYALINLLAAVIVILYYKKKMTD